MDIQSLRNQLVEAPLQHVPAWTVAAFDVNKGDLPRRKLDAKGMELYLKALANAGAPGVLLAASTGWGHARNFEEHQETLLQGGKMDLGTCVKQALLRIEDPLDKNKQLLVQLAQLDYGIVWTRRGSILPPTASDEEVAQNMLPLVSAAIDADLPVGIYSISTVDGAPLTPGAAAILLKMLGEKAKQVVAIKITEPNFETSTQLFLENEAFANKKIVQGWDAFYSKAMQAGKRADGLNQCGATSGAAACMVHAFKAMYELTTSENWADLQVLQSVVSEVFHSMQGEDKNVFPDLQTAKWVMGLGQPLTESRGEENAKTLLAKLVQLSNNGTSAPSVTLIIKSLLLMEESSYFNIPEKSILKQLQGKIP